jgi:hypothetical protein
MSDIVERFERQIKHFGKDGIFYAFLTGNKHTIIYNDKEVLIENGLVELKFEDFENYKIDEKLDSPICMVPNIKLKLAP